MFLFPEKHSWIQRSPEFEAFKGQKIFYSESILLRRRNWFKTSWERSSRKNVIFAKVARKIHAYPTSCRDECGGKLSFEKVTHCRKGCRKGCPEIDFDAISLVSLIQFAAAKIFLLLWSMYKFLFLEIEIRNSGCFRAKRIFSTLCFYTLINFDRTYLEFLKNSFLFDSDEIYRS